MDEPRRRLQLALHMEGLMEAELQAKERARTLLRSLIRWEWVRDPVEGAHQVSGSRTLLRALIR